MLNRLRTFYCGFVFCDQMACSLGGCCFDLVVRWRLVWKLLGKRVTKTWCSNSLKNHINNQWKIIENLPKMVPNPTKIDQKRHPNQWKCVLGPFSAQNRDQVASRTLPGMVPFWSKMLGNPFCAFLVENGVPRVHFGIQRGPKIHGKTHFWW